MPTPEERFWTSVLSEGECLIWQKSKRPNGYGQVNYKGQIFRTHRLAYELTYGPIPPGMCVCHRCDVRACINPNHLFLGDLGDNNRDMFQKGRGFKFDGSHIRGSKNWNAKLTPETAAETRRLRAAGARLQDIADKFGVTKQAIWCCVHNRTWVARLGYGNELTTGGTAPTINPMQATTR